MRTKWYAIVIAAVLLLGPTWLAVRHWRARELAGLAEASLRLFVDDSAVSHRDVYLFSRERVAAMRLRRNDWRLIGGYSVALDATGARSPWLTGNGDARPPFEPPGPWYSRVDFGESEVQVFFESRHAGVSAWLSGVRDGVFREVNRQEGVPELFRSNPRVLRRVWVRGKRSAGEGVAGHGWRGRFSVSDQMCRRGITCTDRIGASGG